MLNRPWGLGLSSVVLCLFSICCGRTPAAAPDSPQASKLIAEASSGQSASKVQYERTPRETRLEVAFAGGAPREVISVLINGRPAATVSLDSGGAARVAYSSAPGAGRELPLSQTFPQVKAGDTVLVGSLQSQFRINSAGGSSNSNGNDNDSNDNIGDDDNDNSSDDGDANDNEDVGEDNHEGKSLELVAKMSQDSLQIDAKFEVESEESKLEVEVSGGEPGALVEIRIAGKLVGTIVLDARGDAQVAFSNDSEGGSSKESPLPIDFVPPAAGDTIVVGSLSGTFVAHNDDSSADDSDDDDASNGDNENSNDNVHEGESDDDSVENNANDDENDKSHDGGVENDNGHDDSNKGESEEGHEDESGDDGAHDNHGDT